MNRKTLFDLSYGVCIIGAKDNERNSGCVVTTVSQATAEPVTVTVCINRENFTNACIKKTKEFSVSILSEKAKESTFGVFGFSSSREKDKFAQVQCGSTPNGLPYVKEGCTGYLQCKVINFIDNFTHTIFIAEVQEAEKISDEPPMTYAYYHQVIKLKAPKTASTYVAEEKKAPPESGVYRCSICGYEFTGSREDFDHLPDSYQCPVCGVAKSLFITG